MKLTLTIKGRVAGVDVKTVLVRRHIESGSLTNQLELVCYIEGFGDMVLDDDIQIEVYDTGVPKEERRWTTVLASQLKADLLAGKYVKKKISSP